MLKHPGASDGQVKRVLLGFEALAPSIKSPRNLETKGGTDVPLPPPSASKRPKCPYAQEYQPMEGSLQNFKKDPGPMTSQQRDAKGRRLNRRS